MIDGERYFDFRYSRPTLRHIIDDGLLIAVYLKPDRQTSVPGNRRIDQLLDQLRRFRSLMAFANEYDIAGLDVLLDDGQIAGQNNAWH